MSSLNYLSTPAGIPIERVTLGLPVIDTNHAQIHAANAFSLIGTMTVAQSQTGIIQIYVPGNDKATKTTDMTNANADITLTAVTAGSDGNDISITYTDPGGVTATLAVTVSGTDITVSLGRAASAINSTANAVKAAIEAVAAAAALVTVTVEGTGLGIVNAVVKANLTGGDEPVYVHFQAAEFTSSAGPGTVSLLEDYTLTSEAGASTLTPPNRHRITGTASELVIKALANAAASNGASALTLATIPMQGSGVGQNRIAAQVSNSQEWILKTQEHYLITFSHSVAGNVIFGYNLFWYEEPGA